MLDLSSITDQDAKDKLDQVLKLTPAKSTDKWRLLSSSRELLEHFSFASTRTYPRPDHPDPRKRRSIYFLTAGILVSLRTTLENEQVAMSRLMEIARTDDDLFALTVVEIENLIRPAGMASQKASRIYVCIRAIREYPGGFLALQNVDIGLARDFLLSLPGIGPKAADCLLTIGLGRPSMVVDVNVFRSAQWVLCGEVQGKFSNTADVAHTKARLDKALNGEDAFVFQIVHTMLLLMGKTMGRKGHQPEKCVGSAFCVACSSALTLI